MKKAANTMIPFREVSPNSLRFDEKICIHSINNFILPFYWMNTKMIQTGCDPINA